MFKPQFADLVERDIKFQTVRPKPKRMPEPGDSLSLREWTGRPYHSKQRVLKETAVLAVSEIMIYGDSIQINDTRLSSEQREDFARADGFDDFGEMADWFRKTHDLPFEGIVIYWPKPQPRLDRHVRRVFFTMVLHPETGWTRVGRCYGTKKSARQWLPLVRGAWRGLYVKVSQCTLRWKDGQMTESSRKTLSEKFNMEPPDSSPNR